MFRFGISLAFLKIIFLQWRNFDVAFIPPLTLAPPLGGSFLCKRLLQIWYSIKIEILSQNAKEERIIHFDDGSLTSHVKMRQSAYIAHLVKLPSFLRISEFKIK